MARINCELFIVIILLFTVVYGCHYNTCRASTGEYYYHTMCQFPELSFGSACKVSNYVKQSFLTDSEKVNILNLHNILRNKVANGKETRGLNGPQPSGTIGPLQWDNELAEIAQRWANQCVFVNDKCRDVERFSVGQNLGYTENNIGFVNEFTEIVQLWYDEVVNYNSNQLIAYGLQEHPLIAHYTQLIWADTTRIGCGGIKYKNGASYRTHLVCNYGPRGNNIGAPVYQPIYQTHQPHNSIIQQEKLVLSNDKETPIISTGDCKYHSCPDPLFYWITHKHTMCQYPESTLSKNCHDVRQSSLNSIDKMNILDFHNNIRDRVARGEEIRGLVGGQPGGIIKPLVWNEELAQIAQRWANQCNTITSICNNIDSFKVGQTIGIIQSTNEFMDEFRDVVRKWYNQVKNFDRRRIYQYRPDPNTVAYSQLVWANTTDVGCGGVKYKDGIFFKTYLVCNYAPTGNSIDQTVYLPII